MSKLSFFMLEAEITSENSEQIFKTITQALSGKSIPNPPQLASDRTPVSRAPVSQHIDTPAPVGSNAEPKMYTCTSCGWDRFRTKQGLHNHQNKCDGRTPEQRQRDQQSEWARTHRRKKAPATPIKSNGHQRPETFPCPVPDCTFGPFENPKRLDTHNRKYHPAL